MSDSEISFTIPDSSDSVIADFSPAKVANTTTDNAEAVIKENNPEIPTISSEKNNLHVVNTLAEPKSGFSALAETASPFSSMNTDSAITASSVVGFRESRLMSLNESCMTDFEDTFHSANVTLEVEKSRCDQTLDLDAVISCMASTHLDKSRDLPTSGAESTTPNVSLDSNNATFSCAANFATTTSGSSSTNTTPLINGQLEEAANSPCQGAGDVRGSVSESLVRETTDISPNVSSTNVHSSYDSNVPSPSKAAGSTRLSLSEVSSIDMIVSNVQFDDAQVTSTALSEPVPIHVSPQKKNNSPAVKSPLKSPRSQQPTLSDNMTPSSNLVEFSEKTAEHSQSFDATSTPKKRNFDLNLTSPLPPKRAHNDTEPFEPDPDQEPVMVFTTEQPFKPHVHQSPLNNGTSRNSLDMMIPENVQETSDFPETLNKSIDKTNDEEAAGKQVVESGKEPLPDSKPVLSTPETPRLLNDVPTVEGTPRVSGRISLPSKNNATFTDRLEAVNADSSGGDSEFADACDTTFALELSASADRTMMGSFSEKPKFDLMLNDSAKTGSPLCLGSFVLNAATDAQQMMENVRNLLDSSMANDAECVKISDGENFVAASEFFKNPADFDLLESAASSAQSNSELARCSLYLKFDPLMEESRPSNVDMLRNGDVMNGNHINNTETPINGSQTDLVDAPKTPSSNIMESDNLVSLTPSPQKCVITAVQTSDAQCQTDILVEKSEEKAPAAEIDVGEDAAHCDCGKVREQSVQMAETMQVMEMLLIEREERMANGVSSPRRSAASPLVENGVSRNVERMKVEVQEKEREISNMTKTFSDMVARYEKLKEQALSLQQLCEKQASTIVDLGARLEDELVQREQVELELAAKTKQVEQVAVETRKNMETELAITDSKLRKAESHNRRLEAQLAQKEQEINEVNGLYDDLMARMKTS